MQYNLGDAPPGKKERKRNSMNQVTQFGRAWARRGNAPWTRGPAPERIETGLFPHVSRVPHVHHCVHRHRAHHPHGAHGAHGASPSPAAAVVFAVGDTRDCQRNDGGRGVGRGEEDASDELPAGVARRLPRITSGHYRPITHEFLCIGIEISLD